MLALHTHTLRLLLLLFRSLVDELHELVELRGDDNLSAAIALPTHLSVVSSKPRDFSCRYVAIA